MFANNNLGIAMRTKQLVSALLVVSVSACGEQSPAPLYLDEAPAAPDTDGGALDEPPQDESLAEMLSRFQPILEGRSYKVRARNPLGGADAELETFDVSLSGAPRSVPEVSLPVAQANNSRAVPASTLIALACAYEIPIASDTISPGLGEGISAINPGTPVQGGVLDTVPLPQYREIPQWPSQVYFQAFVYGAQQFFAQDCNAQLHWAQEMNLCIARRYLDLAKTDAEWQMVMEPVASPRSRVPAGDDQRYACNDALSLNRCQVLGLTMQGAPKLEDEAATREQAMRNYLLTALSTADDLGAANDGFTTQEQARRLAVGAGYLFGDEYLPAQGTQSDAEYLETILPFYLQPLASFPRQEASDRATLALLASNFYLAAQDVGQRIIQCQLDAVPLGDNMQWVDKYNHDAVRVNELVVGRLNEAMLGSTDAAAKAQEYITAAASKRIAGDSSDEANQLFWRGRTNSRLECLHAWTDLSPTLFQAEEADPASLNDSALYPIFAESTTTEDIDKAEQILRDARVNPALALKPGGITDLAEALRFALHAQMPYSFGDIDFDGDETTVLATMGISEDDLRAAAFRMVDTSRVLGKPIVELNGTNGAPLEAIPNPSGGPVRYYYVHGTEITTSVAQPAYIYARSVGVATNNTVPAFTGGRTRFAYQGVVNGLAGSEQVLQRLAESFRVPVPDTSMTKPFFVADSTVPLRMRAQSAKDEDLVHLVQDAIGTASHWAPGILGLCPDGLLEYHSDERSDETNPDIPEAWRGEEGLECALSGRFGNSSCNETALRLTYAVAPTRMGTARQPSSGKFAFSGRLNLAGVAQGERIYFTRRAGTTGRKVLTGVTLGNVCNWYPYGEALLEKAKECLAVQPKNPAKPAICCAGLPCDLKIPLEDSLQSTPARDVESSYMHYITLAREAATRADTLGDELVHQGLTMDMRAEQAREELEGLCGGVVNVETLGPKACDSDSDCRAPNSTSGMRCMASTGLVSGARFCTGGNVVETMENNATFECNTNAECGMGRICISDGTSLKYCATSCVPGGSGASNPCGAQCVTGPSGPYCAVTCTMDNQCTGGRVCSPEDGSGIRTCVPSPEGFRSVQECLGLAQDNQLVPAAIGKGELRAWQFPGHALCTCPAGQTCPPPYDPTTGFATCPVAKSAPTFTVPPGATEVPITDTLGFGTDIGAGGRAAGVCRALAEVRANRPSNGNLEVLLNMILDQPWLTVAGMDKVGSTLEARYDHFGHLTIAYEGSPWLTTGTTNGPLPSTMFPIAPLMASADPICSTTPSDVAPLAGRPLQCRSYGRGGDFRLSDQQLIRSVQILKYLARDTRAPMLGKIDYERQPSGSPPGAEGAGLYFVPLQGYDHPAPAWIQAIDPNAFMRRVGFGELRSGVVVSIDTKPREKIGVDNQSDRYDDGIQVNKPSCLDTSSTTIPTGLQGLMADIGCRPYAADGHLSRFKAYTNGNRHMGLFINQDTDSYGVGAVDNILANNSSWGTIRYALTQLINSDAYPGKDRATAPLHTAGYSTTGGPFTNSQVLDALELGCMINAQPRGLQVGLQAECDREALREPPSITGPKDFPKLVNNLRCAADAVDEDLSRMWVPSIPKAIAAAIRESNVTDTVPNYQGQYAETVAKLQGSFKTVSESTRTVASQLRTFANELTQAQSILEKIDKDGKILNWKLVADIAAQVAECGGTAASFGTLTGASAVACANSAVQIASAIAISTLEQDKLDEDKKQALVQVSMQFSDRIDNIESAAAALRAGYTDIQVLQAELQSIRNAAERAAAKVMGLDRDASGRTYNVNTVSRRSMNTLQVRYDNALVDAKRMAFIARRSIEQRLAMSMDDMTQPMSLVEAPNTWVDTACSMGGLDYSRIRNADVSPIEGGAADDFAEGYIGDYVTKLENFVESYRFEYPFRDGSDVAVVSLRDDVKGVTAPCESEGPNLLYFTADMQTESFAGEELEVQPPIWQDVSDDGTAILLTPTGTSPKGVDLDENGAGYGALIPGGAAYVMSAASTPADNIARAYWGQDLWIEDGLYQLSWYERTGTADDGCAMPPSPGQPRVRPEVLGIEDGSGSFVSDIPQLVPLSFGPDRNAEEDFIQSCWRRWVVEVDVSEAQMARVQFGLQTETVPATWAQPQLERVDNRDVRFDGETGDEETEAWPLAYFPTTETLTAQFGQCEDTTGEVFQGEWLSGDSHCENICPDGTGDSCAQYESNTTFAQQCYQELRFDIGPGMLERGELMPIARGNFNYRYSRFGINLVGTGLRNCENAQLVTLNCPSCFVQYSLRHDGQFSVTNHVGHREDVPLFPAQIQHAKALTAERYLTSPISGADRSLMEDFWRSELRGRPLQGQYTLRVYDIPGPNGENVFDMSKLEDVQLIFEYNYWTRAEQ